MNQAIKNLVDEHGSVRQLALRMGLSDVYLGRILKLDEIPPNLARDIEFLSRGEVTAEELCPSVFKPRWDEFQKMSAHKQRKVSLLGRTKGR